MKTKSVVLYYAKHTVQSPFFLLLLSEWRFLIALLEFQGACLDGDVDVSGQTLVDFLDDLCQVVVSLIFLYTFEQVRDKEQI